MAVAGLHNVSVLESSYHGENYSSASRRWGNHERPTSRTSSIRKMWRELEGENRSRENGRQQINGMSNGSFGCTMSYTGAESEDASIDENEVENECPPNQNQVGLQNGPGNDHNFCSLRSPAIGLAEKERVRQIFREWGSKSFEVRTSYVSNINSCSRAQWVGDNECKKVRIGRELTELSTQQADTCRASIEEQATEIGWHIKRVRGVGAQSSIRRLYGRQALLDLLAKFERERKRELQSLLEKRLVSKFAHRNRIQSLLKGRFLLTQRFVQVEKRTSVAASELGLLRQTHAVSDLRKGFQSKLVNDERNSNGTHSETSSDNGVKSHSNEQTEENSQELSDETVDKSETTITGSNNGGMRKDAGVSQGSPQAFAALAGERHGQVAENQGREQPPPSDTVVETQDQDQEDSVERNQGVYHIAPSRETIGTGNPSQCPLLDTDESMHDQDREDSVERNQGVHHIASTRETLGAGSTSQNPLLEADEIMHDQDLSIRDEQDAHDASAHQGPSKTSTYSLSWQEGSAHSEELQEPANIDDEDLDVNSTGEDEHGWDQETSAIDYQESHEEWYDNVQEETTNDWLGGTSYREAAPFGGRTETFYSSDDENGNRLELRELMSRRRVSNLLQSDFRVRLDRLIHSYLERQDQAFDSDDEWMLDQEQQDREPQSVDENEGVPETVERTEGAPPSSQPTDPQTFWDDDMLDVANWQHSDIHQHFGTEWEVVNGLRIEMSRLQERMNDMQRMLEACMNMQLELQRSVQQEVSSALNRSSNSVGLQKDEAKSSPGKQGVCVLCSDNSFDSSPDRSGHVYVCSNCAEKVNWSKLKESVRHP